MSFDKQVCPILHRLALELLTDRPQEGSPLYGKLKLVVDYLNILVNGQWDRLGDDERIIFIRDMRSDFNLRSWDSYLKVGGGAYDEISKLLQFQQKSMNNSA